MTAPRYYYLQTVATPRPGVYKVLLHLGQIVRHIGSIDYNGEPTYKTHRSASHLHIKTQSLAVNLDVIKRFKVAWVCIEYSGEMLWSKASDLLKKGFVLTFKNQGFEPQIFLRLKDWAKKKDKDEDRDLFSAA